MANDVSFRHKGIALVSLWSVSTLIAVMFKLSQVHDKYVYSPASAVVMIETFKLICSLIIAGFQVCRATASADPFYRAYYNFFAKDFSKGLLMHSLGLAVSYAIVNNVTFAIFIHSPGSTFYLLKAASPVVTAIMLKVMVDRHIAPLQWISISAQCLGLLLTQYNPCTRSSELSMLAYILILVNVAVSCAAGVWNEHIIKTVCPNVSVNVQ
eukprot:PhF_6_TR14184/c0_g1_i2/m.22711/K15272/SLC35A1_2_3; solute carrier family 35 (UDP-sugar transporter), member A1/2/3